MKAVVVPDSDHRIILTQEMRKAAGLKAGERLEASVSPGVITLTVPAVKAKLKKKGKLTIIDAPVPDIGITEAVNLGRRYER